MNNIEREEALARLRMTGWTTQEIEHLCQFQQRYAHHQQRSSRSHQRPALVRWLIALLQEGTPKLSDFWWRKEYRKSPEEKEN